jgi:hypothetical protein
MADTDETTKPEQIALALVEATQDFVEALMMISEALGPDHEDDLERAIGCIRSATRRARSSIPTPPAGWRRRPPDQPEQAS